MKISNKEIYNLYRAVIKKHGTLQDDIIIIENINGKLKLINFGFRNPYTKYIYSDFPTQSLLETLCPNLSNYEIFKFWIISDINGITLDKKLWALQELNKRLGA